MGSSAQNPSVWYGSKENSEGRAGLDRAPWVSERGLRGAASTGSKGAGEVEGWRGRVIETRPRTLPIEGDADLVGASTVESGRQCAANGADGRVVAGCGDGVAERVTRLRLCHHATLVRGSAVEAVAGDQERDAATSTQDGSSRGLVRACKQQQRRGACRQQQRTGAFAKGAAGPVFEALRGNLLSRAHWRQHR